MDVTTILVGIAAFIVSAVVIYAISAFSMREKTFEEVIEEQRRRQEEEREKIKAEKRAEREQTKKKFKKGKQDKSKDKSTPVIEPEIQAETKMVNLEIDPEIIEPTESLGLTSSVRNRKKDKSTKSILHNKDEVAPVAEKTVEVHHKQVPPKDELEMKKMFDHHVKEKFEKVQVSHAEGKVKEKKSKISASTESKENLPPQRSEKEEPKASKLVNQEKIKAVEVEKRFSKPKSSGDDVQLNGTRVISYVRSAKLSDDEVQSLIDILLNKQGLTPSGPVMKDDSWNKKSQKGDPVFALKKQLEEKEKIIIEEQKAAQSANSRVKDIRNELIAEKTKNSSIEKQYQEKTKRFQAEMEALQERMRKTHEQHTAERNTLHARLTQAEQGGDKAALQKITDENKILQESLSARAKESASLADKLKLMEKDLSNSSSKIQAAEAARKSAESKLNATEGKLKKFETNEKEVDALVGKRVEEVSQELRKAEACNHNLNSELQNATGALTVAKGEVSTLKSKLEELEKHLTHSGGVESKLQNSERKRSDLEGNVKNLEKQLADVSKRLSDKDTEVKTLQQDKQRLSTENKTISERLQSTPAPNGDIHQESERRLTEKTKEISELSSNLESQKKAVSNLQGQLDAQKMEVSNLQHQLSQQKEKNNELRAKNWKAMEALEKTEKSSAEKVDRALKSARDNASSLSSEVETYDKAVLQRLFPEVQVGEKLPHKDWMTSFEKQASKKLSNAASKEELKQMEKEKDLLLKQIADQKNSLKDMSSNVDRLKSLEKENATLKSQKSSKGDSNKFSELEADNNRLKKEVENYQNIFSETENKLHQLEKSIDIEEKKWQEKLKAALASASQSPTSDKELTELKSVVSKQEEQVSEYRRVLASTEERLQKLGDRIVSEEKAWKDKLSTSEAALSQARQELSNLRNQLHNSHGNDEELSDLGFAYRCVEQSLTSIVDELQIKIQDLEGRVKESEEKVIVITQEKEKSVSEMTSQLEAERKKNKELNHNVVKLNGIIKTGHDALKAEQSTVKKLQEQLDSKSMASGISELEEAEQLRIKLKEQQKHLEHEIATNKHLSERLAASTGENGTSV